MKTISLPISDDIIRSLQVGDPVSLSGVMITGRDTVHKWIIDTFIRNNRQAEGDDQEVYDASQLPARRRAFVKSPTRAR